MGAERNFDLRLRMDEERRGPFRDTISRGIGGTLPLTRRTRVGRVLIGCLRKRGREGGAKRRKKEKI